LTGVVLMTLGMNPDGFQFAPVGCTRPLLFAQRTINAKSSHAADVTWGMARHMWNGPAGKCFFEKIHPAGTVRSYVRPFSAVVDRWPR
jgi:hypothetical protein